MDSTAELERPRVPRECDTSDAMGYVEWHTWADRKIRQGHKQVFCAACQGYRFRSERCRFFVKGIDPVGYHDTGLGEAERQVADE